MPTIEVVPDLILDDELFGAMAGGLALHAPEQPELTWESVIDATRWWLVPGPDDDDFGRPLLYKAEFLIAQTLGLSIKANVWFRPDLRSAETSKPHNHPWEVMEAHPVLGGYEDQHWHRTTSGLLVAQGGAVNLPGSVNRIFARDYHEVTSIADPGRTVSIMICGPWIHNEAHQGIWGHLDLHTGKHVPFQRNEVEQARFRQRMYRINPQHSAAA